MSKSGVLSMVLISLVSQASFAQSGLGGTYSNVRPPFAQSEEQGVSVVQSLREMGTAQFWKDSAAIFESQYLNSDAWKKMGFTLPTMMGGLAVTYGVGAEIMMRAYGVADPMTANMMFCADLYGNLPRFMIKYSKPGTRRHEIYKHYIEMYEGAKNSPLPESDARMLRRYSRGAIGVGVGLLAGAYWLHEYLKSEDPKTADIYDSPAKMAQILASDMTDEEIVELAKKHEGLKINLIATSERFKELQMWDKINAE